MAKKGKFKVGDVVAAYHYKYVIVNKYHDNYRLFSLQDFNTYKETVIFIDDVCTKLLY